MIRTFSEAVKYLELFIPDKTKKFPGEYGFKRMQEFVKLLGHPQLKYPTIHVGGTSGKGSTATIIASILATKYKVGLHTSPHLIRINERIKIICRHSGKERSDASRISKRSWTSQDDISDEEFILLVNQIKPVVKEMEKEELGNPSYFEIVTAMAFLYFAKQKVDVAVVEVGLGGRYDATNVIYPLVAVLTNVGLDHTEILGDTVEKIASDKAGIIKSGIKVVSGVKQKSVVRILKSRIKNQEASLSLLGKDFNYKITTVSKEGSVFNYQGDKAYKNLHISLLGRHQVENASIALRAIEISNFKFQISNKQIREGLKNAYIPGRMEIVSRKPLIILDGAHNEDKMRALRQAIQEIFPAKKVTAIVAIKDDKNYLPMLQELVSFCRQIIFTKYEVMTEQGIISSYDPKELLSFAQSIQQQRYTSRYTKVVKKIQALNNVKKAIEEATKSASPDNLILITGSLYLVGEIKKISNNFRLLK